MKNLYEMPEVFELGRAEELILGNPKVIGMPDSSSDPLQYNGADDGEE